MGEGHRGTRAGSRESSSRGDRAGSSEGALEELIVKLELHDVIVEASASFRARRLLHWGCGHRQTATMCCFCSVSQSPKAGVVFWKEGCAVAFVKNEMFISRPSRAVAATSSPRSVRPATRAHARAAHPPRASSPKQKYKQGTTQNQPPAEGDSPLVPNVTLNDRAPSSTRADNYLHAALRSR